MAVCWSWVWDVSMLICTGSLVVHRSHAFRTSFFSLIWSAKVRLMQYFSQLCRGLIHPIEILWKAQAIACSVAFPKEIFSSRPGRALQLLSPFDGPKSIPALRGTTLLVKGSFDQIVVFKIFSEPIASLTISVYDGSRAPGAENSHPTGRWPFHPQRDTSLVTFKTTGPNPYTGPNTIQNQLSKQGPNTITNHYPNHQTPLEITKLRNH